jgi:hypothetical protein
MASKHEPHRSRGDLSGFTMSRDLGYSEPLRFRIFGPGGHGDYPSDRLRNDLTK